MASVIKAGNATDGVQVTSDNTGILELKTGTGSGTTAMTVGTGQNVTFAQAANLPNTFGFKNRIINGGMRIDQRNAGASVAVSAGSVQYTVDRWAVFEDTAGAVSFQQITDAPTGFNNSARITVTTGSGSLSAGQRTIFFQPIEGFNVADLGFGTAAAQTITVSFLVKSSLTGQFSGAVTNGGSRSYPFTYTISAANTWETKTVTIAGDTTGTWGTGNLTGMSMVFSLGVGSNFAGTAGAWAAGDFNGATGSVNLLATNGATWQITGVQLEKGSTATSFDYRPYGTELQLCQRYYAKMGSAGKNYVGFGTGLFQSTILGSVVGKYPVSMRSSPTIAQSTCAVFDGTSVIAVTAIGTQYGGTDSFNMDISVASGGTANRPITFVLNNSTAGFLEFSSEL